MPPYDSKGRGVCAVGGWGCWVWRGSMRWAGRLLHVERGQPEKRGAGRVVAGLSGCGSRPPTPYIFNTGFFGSTPPTKILAVFLDLCTPPLKFFLIFAIINI